MAKIEIVVDRNPGVETDVGIFLDGRRLAWPDLQAADIHVVTIDPGAGGADDEWQETMLSSVSGASPAVAELVGQRIEEYVDRYPPEHWPG